MASASNDYWVIGRAEKDKRLIIVECQVTGRLGYVHTFTDEQWERAGTAAVNAYRWNPKWGEVTELTATVA
jgi:hypothetical protein